MRRGFLWGIPVLLMSASVYAEESLKVPGETLAERMGWILKSLLPVPKPVWITIGILAVLILAVVVWYRLGEEKKRDGKKK